MIENTSVSALPTTAPLRRLAPSLLAAAIGIAVAYGYEVRPLIEVGRSLPLSDMAAGLAQAFNQIGSLNIPLSTRHHAQTPSA